MKESDIEEFTKALTITAALFKESNTPEMIKLYFEILKKYEIEDIKWALRQHLETSKFFPKPAELIAFINKPESIEDKANKAWNLLLKSIGRYGYYDSVQFEDKIIHSCVRAMGGWMQVSDREPDTWMHKDFVNFYKSYQNTTHPDKVTGMIEKQNGRATLAFVPNDTEAKIIEYLKPAHEIKSLSGVNKIGNILQK